MLAYGLRQVFTGLGKDKARIFHKANLIHFEGLLFFQDDVFPTIFD